MLSQVIYGRRESQKKRQLTANGQRGLPNCKGACLKSGTDKKDDGTWNPLLEVQKGRKTKKAAKKIGSSAESRGGACAVRAPEEGIERPQRLRRMGLGNARMRNAAARNALLDCVSATRLAQSHPITRNAPRATIRARTTGSSRESRQW